MPIITYKKTNGMAHDLMFKSEKNIEKDDIVFGEGDALPNIETLHDKEYILAQGRVAAGVKAQASLDDIDARSIRSIREWLVQQPTASQALKDLETQAIALRKQLQGG